MIGVCSVTFIDLQPAEIIALAVKAGLQVIEWAERKHVPVNDLAHARQVRHLTEQAGLVVCSYGSYYQAGSFEDFKPYLETAKALNTAMIRVWAGDKDSQIASIEEIQAVIADSERIAELAAADQISISFEYHNHTLTDTPASAKQLMAAIQADNVHLYWQPNEFLSPAERLASLNDLAPYVTNVHVFNWQDYYHRFPLAEAKADWIAYLQKIRALSPHDNHLLLEFVKDDSPEQFLDDSETLKTIQDESKGVVTGVGWSK